MKRNPPADWHRPRALHEVVDPARTTEDIGLNLAEFLDQVNLLVRKKTGRRALHAGDSCRNRRRSPPEGLFRLLATREGQELRPKGLPDNYRFSCTTFAGGKPLK